MRTFVRKKVTLCLAGAVIILGALMMSTAGTVFASDPFIGEIRIFAGNFAPRGWAFCEGQLLPIAQNTALFSLVGTMYGGDGRTTFGLPDLKGRFALNSGNGPGLTPRSQGSRGGAETHTLNGPELPSHAHSVNLTACDEAGTSASPAGNMLAVSESGFAGFDNGSTDVAMAEDAVRITASGTAHENMPPYLGVNYIIALVGIFPSRN